MRQTYLEGFEGANLDPKRKAMVEAYVNGDAGQAVSNKRLCEIGAFNTKNDDSARTVVWKVFKSQADRHQSTYASEREYMRYLQAQNTLRSVWDADQIRQRLQRNVLIAQGDVPAPRLVTATYKGEITTEVQHVKTVDLSAANTALMLLGKSQGMFGEEKKNNGNSAGTSAEERELSNTERAARVFAILKQARPMGAGSDTTGTDGDLGTVTGAADTSL